MAFHTVLLDKHIIRITDEGSVPEMRIWSISLIKSDLKWCIHLSRSIFLCLNELIFHLHWNMCPKSKNATNKMSTIFWWRRRSWLARKHKLGRGSANQRPGRLSSFSIRAEKHKICRGHCDLPSRQVALNSVQRFQRRSRKCLSKSKAGAAILFFQSARKTQTW